LNRMFWVSKCKRWKWYSRVLCFMMCI